MTEDELERRSVRNRDILHADKAAHIDDGTRVVGTDHGGGAVVVDEKLAVLKPAPSFGPSGACAGLRTVLEVGLIENEVPLVARQT